MSIDCLRPLFKILAKFIGWDLKQNAFLRRWIYYMKPLSLGKKITFFALAYSLFSPHQQCKNSANEQNSNLFKSFTASVAYFRTGKYKYFFTINAQKGIYISSHNSNVMCFIHNVRHRITIFP